MNLGLNNYLLSKFAELSLWSYPHVATLLLLHLLPTQHLCMSSKYVTFNISRMILDSYPRPD